MYAQTLAEAVTKGYGVERPFLCPVHGDTRPSASLNIHKQKWYCYTCGAHGSLTGEAALMEPDYLEMKLWLMAKMEENRVYPESWLARWDAGDIHPYWLDRVGAAAARAFRLGFDPERSAVTYPLRRADGAVLGVVRRGLENQNGPKYLYPRGIDIGRLLFNYTPEAQRVVVLCEGAVDAIAFWGVGIHAFAIYGSRISDTQQTLVDRCDPDYVFTAFDNDDAGFQAHREAERRFAHRLVGRVTWPYSWGKDVAEIGPEKLREVSGEILECQGVTCIESPTCESYESPTRVINFSAISSKPEQLSLLPRSS